ncbi:cathepsin propeptide inhibitor domain (I29) domain-containing protein [Phthorimaea operculella]|nr:cathepsin propeptide inhibitor domain (I29) domain-containing protein [Phthorimaea operculella]
MKVLIFLCFVALVALTSARRDPYADKRPPHYDLNNAKNLYEDFIKRYGRTFKNQREYQIRFEAFKKSLDGVNKINETPGITWVADINYMSDFTSEERKQMMGILNGIHPPLTIGSRPLITG